MTFTSNEAGRFEVYAIRFDPNATSPATPVQISDQGGTGMVFWRRDGKELYYLAADRAIMAGGGRRFDGGVRQADVTIPPVR